MVNPIRYPYLPMLRDQRVLVLGATGWFGRTAVGIMLREGHHGLLLTASRSGQLRIRGRSLPVHKYTKDLVNRFEPQVVLNCAFLTREKVSHVGLENYLETNMTLIRNYEDAVRLPSVRIALTVSSGAVLNYKGSPENDPYGFLKLYEERVSRNLVRPNSSSVVVRAWSVSGDEVQNPHGYAFSDFVWQAMSGKIVVRARGEVWRRYCDLDQLLCCALATGWERQWHLVESGGPLIELRQLAGKVSRTLGNCEVAAVPPRGRSDHYYSDNTQWTSVLRESGVKEFSIVEQIRNVAQSNEASRWCQGYEV